MDSSEAGDVDEIKGMFGLEETTLEVLWKKIIAGRTWKISGENNVEYMRVQPPFTKGYWEKRIPEYLFCELAMLDRKCTICINWMMEIYM